MNTTDKNILIAEFMQPIFNNFNVYLYSGETFKPKDLKFNSDWNWLMEVVEKIEGLGYWVNKINGDVYIQDDNYKTIVNNTEHQGGIEATYNAVIAFIEWYNKQ